MLHRLSVSGLTGFARVQVSVAKLNRIREYQRVAALKNHDLG